MMTEDGDGAVWCPWCRRHIVKLNPHTMKPADALYDGSCLIVHDDVPHLYACEPAEREVHVAPMPVHPEGEQPN